MALHTDLATAAFTMFDERGPHDIGCDELPDVWVERIMAGTSLSRSEMALADAR